MSRTLAERFAEAKGTPIEVDGTTVINMYRRAVSRGKRVHVDAVASTPSPLQGIRIKMNQGTISINEKDLKDVVVWLDTAPSTFEFVCNPQNETGAELRIWNCWRDAGGVTQAWIGNAGIVVEETAGQAVLRCSSGIGPFDPSDLEIRLRFE